jgi:hypothetical protein
MSSVEAISFRRLSWERSNLSDESDWEVDEEVGAGTGKGSGIEVCANWSSFDVSDMLSSTLEIMEMSCVPVNKGGGYLSKEAVREMSRISGWDRSGPEKCWLWPWLWGWVWGWVNGANPGGPLIVKGCFGSPCLETPWIGLLKYSKLF